MTVTATAAMARQGEAKGKGKGKEAHTASGGASGFGWVSHTAAVASMRRHAEWTRNVEDGDGEGGLVESAAGGSGRAARAAGTAPASEGDNPTKGKEKGKGKAVQKMQGAVSGGGPESQRVVAGAAVTSTGATGNLPFRPREAVVGQEEGGGDAGNRRRQRVSLRWWRLLWKDGALRGCFVSRFGFFITLRSGSRIGATLGVLFPREF